MKTPRVNRFTSLTHARMVRDRWAEIFLEDLRPECGEAAREIMERILRAAPGWREELATHVKKMPCYWDGCGIPDWSYTTELEDAIQFIAAEEAARMKAT